jgi:Curli production assembly/transport component CsgG
MPNRPEYPVALRAAVQDLRFLKQDARFLTEDTNMIGFRSQPRFCAPLLLLATLTATGSAALAQDGKQSEIPTCDKKLGTLAVAEPEQKWWLQLNLESPEALLKVYAAQSQCFTLVDRGRGLAAAQQERALASSGELSAGSNISNGQMTAADYVLVPDLVNKNAKAGSKGFGAIGGFLGHRLGGLAGVAIGGVNLKSKTADVVLTLTDVRSTVQLAQVQGHAKKTDIGWGAGGAGYVGAFVAAGASSYANTEIGQVVAMAYLDSFTKLVEQLKQNPPVARAEADTGARADTAGTLTNGGVIQMVLSKLSDAIVIHKIKNSKRAFDTSSAALVALTKAGVSEPVIMAMMEP